MKATELLEKIKNNEVQYAIVNDKGAVYCDKDTDNIMDIYGLSDEEDGHFYGVYGDVVNGQIDNRDADDEVILKAIERMLSLGKVVKRSELNFTELKRTYYRGELIQEAKKQRKENRKCQEWLENHKDLTVGTIVEHATLGKGKITKIENLDKIERTVIYIDFDGKGIRKMMLAYLIKEDLLKVL